MAATVYRKLEKDREEAGEPKTKKVKSIHSPHSRTKKEKIKEYDDKLPGLVKDIKSELAAKKLKKRRESIGKEKTPPKAKPKYVPRITVEFPATWSKQKKQDEKLNKILKEIGVQGNRNNKGP